MAEFEIGNECILYYGTAGSSPSSVVGAVRDVTTDLTTVEADTTSRDSQGWEETAVVLKKGMISFQALAKTTNAGMAAVRTAFNNKSLIALKAVDDAGAGVVFDADFVITKCARSEPLKDVVVWDVEAKTAKSTRLPNFA